ncbi:MAG: transcription-repair coupling factor [Dongiaceae bacterium]
MKLQQLHLQVPGRVLIAGAPDGFDALVLCRLAATPGSGPAAVLVHVAHDDARLARLAEAISFFDPEIEVLRFPAWDCLPYDRVSPHRDIVSQRIDTLTRLLAPAPNRRRIVLTTIAAILQRVPAREFFEGAMYTLKIGPSQGPGVLIGYLAGNGYSRSETVNESGEYAVRGGIVDLFPPGAAQPLRVDFFGDDIDAIRSFDPLTQRSTEKVEAFLLKPVGEYRLDKPTIERFRVGYRARFGAAGADDPLYESISAGRFYAGLEHWLPLFHSRLDTLLDYAAGALVTVDHQAELARDARLELIGDFYQARIAYQKAEEASGAPYRPMPPEAMYLTAKGWDDLLRSRGVAELSPFAPPDGAANCLDAGGRRGRDFAEARTQPGVNVYDVLRTHIEELRRRGRHVAIAGYTTGSLDRLTHLLKDHGVAKLRPARNWSEVENLPADHVALVTLPLDAGFETAEFAVITEPDVVGDRLARPAKKRKRPEQFLAELANFAEGDFVVHVDHGIGRYDGLITLDVGGAPHDCLRVLYDGGDKLFVPVENIDVLSRFSSEDAVVQLDKLGGLGWQSRKARVKQRIREIAGQLIQTAAQRQIKMGQVIMPPDGLYDEFCARFPYVETEDQGRAVEDVLTDLGAGRPMDRLVCGDVGFGKTEVALRAAFVAVMAGFQVAVIVPTTLLCRQHFQTFSERFTGYPVRIRQLSRLVAAKDAAKVKEAIRGGAVDIVIGTHALLGKGIEFNSLGLMIVDEEQHFGVAQKERLKELRADVHVLTLTATPIPRTLQMALSGVREMSLIATPPVDRLAVRTFVLPYDPVILREAIIRERHRGGQIFYICPRIEDLDSAAERLRKLVPEIKFVMAHGQMPARLLEQAMTAFYDRQYDLLLSTSIVESGLDIPTANTIIIHRAEMFGLSQLYQLRGRIGRAKQRGYAYLTLPTNRVLSAVAEKRLQVMQTLDTLGAGFTLASHDLDIRGAGNLLGEEQSGHIREVGIELYQHMLEEAVAEARGGAAAQAAEGWTPQINLGMPVLIPEDYVTDLGVRLGLYRRVATLVDRAEIDAFAAELIDRFGSLPVEVENLLEVVAIKRLCRDAGIDKVEAGPKGAVLSFKDNKFAKPDKLIAFIGRRQPDVSVRPDHKLVYRQSWDSATGRVAGVRKLMEEVAALAA